jgi:uncharacterized lipoprotein
MLKSIITLFSALVIALSSTGCTTLADAQSAKGAGASKIFSATTDDVWKAVPPVLKELGLQMVSENRQQGYILAQRGMTALSYGENVAIYVESAGVVTRTRVEIISKKVLATNVFAPNWEKDILDKLAERLQRAG